MPISFHCETCRRSICVPDGSEGKKTRCPECYSIVRIPFSGNASLFMPEGPLDTIDEQDDPLGITDPENVRPPTPQQQLQANNPFATTSQVSARADQAEPVELPFPGVSPKKFKRYCFELRLCVTVVMVCCLLALVLVAIGVADTLIGYYEKGGDPTVIYAGISFVPVIILHLGTLLCLNEARRMGNLRLAWIGLALSLFPFANYSVCLVFPALFTFWAMYSLNRDEITLSFQSVKPKPTPD
ncbi:hypothetical protein [Bremerella alba]|uniref:Uncharacterized protein n=1 Tax=Bremerella alba TaxID=980252 RepID=A0A7V8V1I0_9BACT|nr:hypothetical protein [Bremerella alba]MBA2113161.1 hypothetical protein [Bremerella alba]